MSFANKVVLITGAGSGIGEAIADHFAKLSAKLALIDIDKDNLNRVAEDCKNLHKTKVFKVVADVSKDSQLKEAITSTVNEFKRIDVLINNAGVGGRDHLIDSNVLDNFDRIISINLRAVVAAIHFAAPALIESRGCVVNISSVLSKLVMRGAVGYTVSKAGVAHLTRCAALELSEHGVRVNCIAPGPVRTNILLNMGLSDEENERAWSTMIDYTAFKRDVKPNDIAELAAFLASDKANNITGCQIPVDAGTILLSRTE